MAAGSSTGASSTTQAPSSWRSAAGRATSNARRVLPTPPGPVSVTRRACSNNSRMRRVSSSRPMNDDGTTGGRKPTERTRLRLRGGRPRAVTHRSRRCSASRSRPDGSRPASPRLRQPAGRPAVPRRCGAAASASMSTAHPPSRRGSAVASAEARRLPPRPDRRRATRRRAPRVPPFAAPPDAALRRARRRRRRDRRTRALPTVERGAEQVGGFARLGVAGASTSDSKRPASTSSGAMSRANPPARLATAEPSCARSRET